jgi:hypothetical protein
MLTALLAATLTSPVALAESDSAPRGGNRLSKRAQLRYQDVLTTRSGSRWRGKLIERGDTFRIRLEDNSEVAVPKAEVVSVTRELHPGFLHKGQWITRASVGAEIAFATGESNAGIQSGPYVELAFGHNFGGAFEPEINVVLAPIGPDDASMVPEIGVSARYYLRPREKAKPFTATQIIFYGSQGDLGLRTGPGFVLDVSPNFGLGVSQGVTLMTQSVDGEASVAIGYHVSLEAQARF